MNALTNPKDISKFVNQEFQSGALNQILFGCEEIEPRDTRDFSIIFRMLSITYIGIYCKWLQLGRACYSYTKGKHAKNVFNLLARIYKVQRLDLDVIIYTITEGRHDALEYKEKSFFFEFFELSLDCKYSKLYDILRKAIDEGDYKPQDIIEHMGCDVIDLKYLHNVEIFVNREKEINNIVLEFNGNKYETYDAFVYYNNTFCVLKDRTIINDSMERTYISLESISEIVYINKFNINSESD